MVRACVLFAAGTNCDEETVRALELAGARAETVHINCTISREVRLADYQLVVLPGGFSYGDYIASGRILAGELLHHLRDELVEFRAAGKPILGICNGFQVLAKAGLLPAFEELFEPQSVTLDTNDSCRYEDRWVHVGVESSPCIFTDGIGPIIYLPVAHAEGKFLAKDAQTLARLQASHQVVLRYVTAAGETAQYPENPNGSEDGIAGICDPTGLILGLMPHPERFVRREHHPQWQRLDFVRIDGIGIFRNAVDHVKKHL
jgi:phosphoribosylformylglycinamidine synthase subunit PurQ / glutaminase